jgi:hypothetical protein
LQGAVFTRDLGAALRFSEDFEVGPLWINEVTRFRRDPFERLLHNRADGHFPTSARSGCDRHVPEAWGSPLVGTASMVRYFILFSIRSRRSAAIFLGPRTTQGFQRRAERQTCCKGRISDSRELRVKRATRCSANHTENKTGCGLAFRRRQLQVIAAVAAHARRLPPGASTPDDSLTTPDCRRVSYG